MKANVLRRFAHNGVKFVKGEIVDIVEDHFKDWLVAGLVSAATHKDDKPKADPKAAK